MRIGDLEFRDKQGNEIEPTKQQMAVVIADLQKQLNQANEKIMWFNAEIDTLKSEKENLMRTLEEASEELECAIVPKFKIGQNVWSIINDKRR